MGSREFRELFETNERNDSAKNLDASGDRFTLVNPRSWCGLGRLFLFNDAEPAASRLCSELSVDV
jgi:hypothetical protein